MSDNEIITILSAITDMRVEVREKFETVFCKVDEVGNRVTVLEGDKIARDATAIVINKQEGIKRDWGKWFIRLTLGAIAVWAVTEMLTKYYIKG